MKALQLPALAWAILLVTLLAGCGASQREKTLKATLIATNAVRDEFVKFDATHQQQLVKDAESFEAGKVSLEAYRKTRERVLTLFEAVYQGIGAALLLDAKAPLTDLLKTAKDLQDTLSTLMKGTP